MLKAIDALKTAEWGRSINPAFSIETPSLSPRIQAVIQRSLPAVNAFSFTRSLLSYGLLAVHTKDLCQELFDIFYTGKSSDEVLPQMKKTASAVCHLSISLWFPYLYLIGTESYNLISLLRPTDPTKGRLQSAAEFFLQSLYLTSILGKSPLWQQLLNQIPQNPMIRGKTELTLETDDGIIRIPAVLIPTFLSTQNVLNALGILPLIFRNVQEIKKGSDAWVLPIRFIQAYYLFNQARQDTFKNLDFKLLSEFATVDFLNEFVDFTTSVVPNFLYALTLLSTIFDVSSRFEAWSRSSFHIGATGDPVKMDDVVGCDKAKKSILMALDKIKHPENYSKLGPSKAVKGVLFYGPPGTGKSMLAKAFATTADNALFIEQPATSFANKYVGEGANNIRKLFNTVSGLALQNPNRLVVVFIDEINTIGAVRNMSSSSGGEKELTNTTQAFLVAMDSLPKNVVVVGATNARPHDLDEAFMRAGRFDKHIEFKLPKKQERIAILSKLSSSYKIDPKITESFWNEFAEKTEDWCYADFTNLFLQASDRTGHEKLPHISQQTLEKTLKKLNKQKDPSGSGHSLPMYV